MKSLKEILEDPERSRALVADILRVVDTEVGKRSGLGGLGIKGTYRVVKGIQGGRILKRAVEILIPEFIEQLDPYYARYLREAGGRTWSDFLHPHLEAIAEALLAVTDRRIHETDNRAVRGAYHKFRPKAKKEVMASMPALARMMERYI